MYVGSPFGNFAGESAFVGYVQEGCVIYVEIEPTPQQAVPEFSDTIYKAEGLTFHCRVVVLYCGEVPADVVHRPIPP